MCPFITDFTYNIIDSYGPINIVIERDSLQLFLSQQDDLQTGKDQNNCTSKPGTNMNTSQAKELQKQRTAHSKAVHFCLIFYCLRMGSSHRHWVFNFHSGNIC